MRIEEIQAHALLKDAKFAQEFDYYLRKKGWQVMGTPGYEAIAAEHPQQKYIIKLFPTKSVYRYFVDMVEQHQDNPHFPKFYKYTHDFKGTSWSLVRMEKLHTPLEPNWLARYPIEMCYLEKRGQERKMNISDDVFLIVVNYIKKITKNKSDPTKNMDTQSYLDMLDDITQNVDPVWAEAVELTINQAKKISLSSLDLNSDNIMMRDDTLVIADPYYRKGLS